jgi:hypothetical protein
VVQHFTDMGGPLAGFTAAWSGLLVSDIILFAMTLAKAIKVGRTRPQGLTKILLRDGMPIFFTPRTELPADVL